MIDIMQETLIPLREAPRRLPPRPNGKRVHISACYRWISRGVRGFRLEAIRIGKRYFDRQQNAWPDTEYFFANDLPWLHLLVERAFKFITPSSRQLDAEANPEASAQHAAEAPETLSE